MSFKREGDDWSQLNVLKKRRVGDLLASYIPEDEALMLRDGRFACAICPHRPEPGADPQAKESAAVSSPAPLSPTRRRALDHYLTLRSSGWIPDGRGRWVKDENVEFDSDEEEPPDLPLD
uniref:Sodium channel modifier 1 n=1 Tax=Myotis myotis TaxID=51298 RepID=A0A7J7STF0_MYOMY|nr:sodium channel modifier 1 [Myotis myotis]